MYLKSWHVVTWKWSHALMFVISLYTIIVFSQLNIFGFVVFKKNGKNKFPNYFCFVLSILLILFYKLSVLPRQHQNIWEILICTSGKYSKPNIFCMWQVFWFCLRYDQSLVLLNTNINILAVDDLLCTKEVNKINM